MNKAYYIKYVLKDYVSSDPERFRVHHYDNSILFLNDPKSAEDVALWLSERPDIYMAWVMEFDAMKGTCYGYGTDYFRRGERRKN